METAHVAEPPNVAEVAQQNPGRETFPSPTPSLANLGSVHIVNMARTKCAVMLEEIANENAAAEHRPPERGGLCVCKCGCQFVDRGVPFDVTVCLHDYRTETSSEMVFTLPSVDSNMTSVILRVAKEFGTPSRNIVVRGPGKKIIRARDTPTSLFLTTHCTLHAHVSTRRRRRRR